jgi:hypothetical protein
MIKALDTARNDTGTRHGTERGARHGTKRKTVATTRVAQMTRVGTVRQQVGMARLQKTTGFDIYLPKLHTEMFIPPKNYTQNRIFHNLNSKS